MKKFLFIFTMTFNLMVNAVDLGSLDTSFSHDGTSDGWDLSGAPGVSHSGSSVAIDSQGRVLVAGFEYSPTEGLSALIKRYLPDGTRDLTIDTQGLAHVLPKPENNNFDENMIKVIPDETGGFFLAYTFNSCEGSGTCIDSNIMHFSENGLQTGGSSLGFDQGDNYFQDMVYIPAIQMIVLAVTVHISDTPFDTDFGIGVFRFTETGHIVPNVDFGFNGRSTCSFNQSITNKTDNARAITTGELYSEVIIGGWSFEGNGAFSSGKNMSFCEFNLLHGNFPPLLSKWSTESLPDNPFSDDEEILTGLSYYTDVISHQAGTDYVKSVVATGTITGVNSDDFALVKYIFDDNSSSWIADANFGPNGSGWSTANFTLLDSNNNLIDTEDKPTGITIEQEDYSILIGGNSEWHDISDRRVAGALLKFNKSGIPEKQWGTDHNGKSLIHLDNVNNPKIFSGIVIEPVSESIFVAGTYPGSNAGWDSTLLAKFHNDRIFATTFD